MAVFDLSLLANSYELHGREWTDGDFNGDGIVDVFDLGLLAGNYSVAATGGQPVPEPTALALLAVAFVAVRRRKRTA